MTRSAQVYSDGRLVKHLPVRVKIAMPNVGSPDRGYFLPKQTVVDKLMATNPVAAVQASTDWDSWVGDHAALTSYNLSSELGKISRVLGIYVKGQNNYTADQRRGIELRLQQARQKLYTTHPPAQVASLLLELATEYEDFGALPFLSNSSYPVTQAFEDMMQKRRDHEAGSAPWRGRRRTAAQKCQIKLKRAQDYLNTFLLPAQVQQVLEPEPIQDVPIAAIPVPPVIPQPEPALVADFPQGFMPVIEPVKDASAVAGPPEPALVADFPQGFLPVSSPTSNLFEAPIEPSDVLPMVDLVPVASQETEIFGRLVDPVEKAAVKNLCETEDTDLSSVSELIKLYEKYVPSKSVASKRVMCDILLGQESMGHYRLKERSHAKSGLPLRPNGRLIQHPVMDARNPGTVMDIQDVLSDENLGKILDTNPEVFYNRFKKNRKLASDARAEAKRWRTREVEDADDPNMHFIDVLWENME